jgi:hypothetical protein
MATDPAAPRTRRALLAAAAGSAAALAASAALPLTAAAADPNDVVKGQDNASTAETGITQSTNGVVAFRATNQTSGAAALVAAAGDTSDIASDTSFTGAYGWSEADSLNGFGAGFWGDSPDTGVVGTGSVGVLGLGAAGVWGIGGGGPGVIGDSEVSTQPGVLARGSTASGLALQVSGKVKFNRSGRTLMSSGTSTKTISLAGVTATSKVFAVLATSESGRYVRAVVPDTGKFKVYLNRSLSSSAKIGWFVLD